MKRTLRLLLAVVVFANVAVFLGLAAFEKLPTDAHSSVFIDFWGRLGVYSMWFLGYGLYRRFLEKLPVARAAVMTALAVNVPLFLGLAYFDKLSPEPTDLPFIDFWGRITVYSVWFVAYELYRKHLAADEPAPPRRESTAG